MEGMGDTQDRAAHVRDVDLDAFNIPEGGFATTSEFLGTHSF